MVTRAQAERIRASRPRGVRPYVPQPTPQIATMWNPGWGDVALPNVTLPTLQGLPAAWRAMNLIANGVAAMAPLQHLQADGITPVALPAPVLRRPNSLMGSFDFWHSAVCHALSSGNFVALLADFDSFGYARQLVPVHSSWVNCRLHDGLPIYDIGDRTYGYDEVFHVRAFTVPGDPWGIGVVTNFRRALGAHLDQQNYAAATWQTGAVPSGILKQKRPNMSQGKIDEAKTAWIAEYGAGRRSVAVLNDEQWEFEPIAWTPEDAQFLESRQFSVAEMAFMFGLDPSDLAATIGGTSQTYANLTDRLATRVTEAYGPVLARFEDAACDIVPGGTIARFRRENLTHANRAALFAEQAAGIAAGILTRDEARAESNKPPLPAPEPPPPPANDQMDPAHTEAMP